MQRQQRPSPILTVTVAKKKVGELLCNQNMQNVIDSHLSLFLSLSLSSLSLKSRKMMKMVSVMSVRTCTVVGCVETSNDSGNQTRRKRHHRSLFLRCKKGGRRENLLKNVADAVGQRDELMELGKAPHPTPSPYTVRRSYNHHHSQLDPSSFSLPCTLDVRTSSRYVSAWNSICHRRHLAGERGDRGKGGQVSSRIFIFRKKYSSY